MRWVLILFMAKTATYIPYLSPSDFKSAADCITYAIDHVGNFDPRFPSDKFICVDVADVGYIIDTHGHISPSRSPLAPGS